MAAWFWYAVVAAVLYGAHQIFTRLAADHIGEGFGGFIVEASAALSILIYLAILWFGGRWNQKFSAAGLNYSLLTGICVGAGTIAFSSFFRKAARSLLFRRFSRVVRQSWPSQAFCSSANHHHGNELAGVAFAIVGLFLLRKEFPELPSSRRLRGIPRIVSVGAMM